jgi:hypothetical protein
LPRAAVAAGPAARVLAIPASADLLLTLPIASPTARPGPSRPEAAPEHRP